MNDVAVRQESPAAAFRGQFDKMGPEIASALPPHIPIERFMRVVLTAVNGNMQLLAADRRSLFEAAMKSAQDGLLPDGREGAFVTFKAKVKNARGQDEWIEKVQWMPMVAGILKKIRNSGELLSLSAHVAYEKDKFAYILGDEESIIHEPLLTGDRGSPTFAYAIAKTKDGAIYREVMTIAEVEKVREVSRAKNSGPWMQWWDEMAKKTVIRRLAKRLPMSTDLDDLIRRDDNLYDFAGKRGEMADGHARLFKPVANPFSDEPPPAPAESVEEPQKAIDGPQEAASDEQPPKPAAYLEGRRARAAGISRKAIPGELRGEDKGEELDQWFTGWDDEDQDGK